MTIGVIAAMNIELEGLASAMERTESETVGGILYISGYISGRRVVAAVSGIGKVFAAVAAEAMIMRYSPDVIINTGVAGGLSDKLKILDVVVADGALMHDFDSGNGRGVIPGFGSGETKIPCDARVVKALSDAVGHEGLDFLVGTVATGDRFICDAADKADIRDTFGAVACEMEGAAVGQVCGINGVPFGIIRAISDGGDDEAVGSFEKFASVAAKNSVAVTKRFIECFDFKEDTTK